MSSRQSPFYVILTERSDEGSRDLSHTFKMTLVVVRDDIESGARWHKLCHPDRALFMSSWQSVATRDLEIFHIRSRWHWEWCEMTLTLSSWQSPFLCHPDRALFYVIPTEPFLCHPDRALFMSSRQSVATRDLEIFHIRSRWHWLWFEMTLVVVRDDIGCGSRWHWLWFEMTLRVVRDDINFVILTELFFMSSWQSSFLCHPDRALFYVIPTEPFFMSSWQSVATRDLEIFHIRSRWHWLWFEMT